MTADEALIAHNPIALRGMRLSMSNLICQTPRGMREGKKAP